MEKASHSKGFTCFCALVLKLMLRKSIHFLCGASKMRFPSNHIAFVHVSGSRREPAYHPSASSEGRTMAQGPVRRDADPFGLGRPRRRGTPWSHGSSGEPAAPEIEEEVQEPCAAETEERAGGPERRLLAWTRAHICEDALKVIGKHRKTIEKPWKTMEKMMKKDEKSDEKGSFWRDHERSGRPKALFLMGLPGAGKTTVKKDRMSKEFFVPRPLFFRRFASFRARKQVKTGENEASQAVLGPKTGRSLR